MLSPSWLSGSLGFSSVVGLLYIDCLDQLLFHVSLGNPDQEVFEGDDDVLLRE